MADLKPEEAEFATLRQQMAIATKERDHFKYSYLRKVAAEASLLQQLGEAKAELRVRTQISLFPDVPEAWRRGAGTAYRAGYESAWRGEAYRQLYERSDCAMAFAHGYQHGEEESRAAIDAARKESC